MGKKKNKTKGDNKLIFTNQSKQKTSFSPYILPQRAKNREKYKTNRYCNPIEDEYRLAARGAAAFFRNNVPLESSFDLAKPYKKKAYDLALLTVKHTNELEYLMYKLKISENLFHIKDFKGRVIITDLLWGDQYLKSATSRAAETIKYFEDDLRENFIEAVYKVSQNPREIPACNLPVYVRINTLRISLEQSIEAFQKEGWTYLSSCKTYSEYLQQLKTRLNGSNFMRDYHISELFVFPPGTNFFEHPGLIRGKFLLQDKASCLSSFLLNPKPNAVVYDMYAATGIKTNHIANLMGNTGKIYANDIHPRRFEFLKDRLSLTGVECAEFSCKQDLDNPVIKLCNYILVDPTSSYSGIFFGVGNPLKSSELRKRKNSLALTLAKTLSRMENGHRLVYTACSVYAEEGEAIVDEVMKDMGNAYRLLNAKEMLWNQWHSRCYENYQCSDACLRVVPEYDNCQGCFIAVFERIPGASIKLEQKIIYNKRIYNISEMQQIDFTTRKGKLVRKWVPIDKATKIMLESKVKFEGKELNSNDQGNTESNKELGDSEEDMNEDYNEEGEMEQKKEFFNPYAEDNLTTNQEYSDPHQEDVVITGQKFNDPYQGKQIPMNTNFSNDPYQGKHTPINTNFSGGKYQDKQMPTNTNLSAGSYQGHQMTINTNFSLAPHTSNQNRPHLISSHYKPK